ncbi:hypothetical protein EIN_320300 [Entamoeba invadens IP1]|uniref:VASt domain-containing protein n=1 Tax=Entamoeba invadens IP1 TaxID=370355 RepID=A0A0A1U5J5_ENTIV|nr:hypothetical protein EIN_320300 [Entamoeba invadens IP1]ELP87041.1 hypothetical protein EIN_320300 [Entamoeba invadens IP1]|eukprot:XP_004253812.1 hypothetical protein EIN_320300 [Entamoeba invadens IP1]
MRRNKDKTSPFVSSVKNITDTNDNELHFLSDKQTDKFNKKFQFSEYLARKYRCSMNNIFHIGKLYIGTRHLCFLPSKFIGKSATVVSWSELTDVVKVSSRCIEIHTDDNHTMVLLTNTKTERIFHDMVLFWQRRSIFNEKQREVKDESSELTDKNSEKKETQRLFTEVPEMVLTSKKFSKAPNDLFMLIFSNCEVLKTFHEKIGQKDFKCSGWKNDSKHGKTIELNYKGVSSVVGVETRVNEKWQFVTTEKGIEIWMVISVFDIPYASYFKVESVMKLETCDGGCTATVLLRVRFVKSTIWKTKIESTTINEYVSKYKNWMKFIAAELGDEKAIEETKMDVKAENAHISYFYIMFLAIILALIILAAVWYFLRK